MKSETILRALANARPEYLEQAAEQRENNGRSLRALPRVGLIAAVLAALLLITGVSAAVLRAPRIHTAKRSRDSYDLSVDGSEAAEDAPGYLARYYLPTALPEGSRLFSATLSWSLHLDWTVRTPKGDGQIAFTMDPLRKGTNPSEHVDGLDLDDLEQGVCEIGGIQYRTMTYATEAGEAAWYYWKDPQNHYLMKAYFTEVIPQDAREAFLSSVAPAGQQEVLALMGLEDQTVWCLGRLPEGVKVDSCAVDNLNVGPMSAQTGASDGRGHNVYLQQNCARLQTDYSAYDKTEIRIDGTTITCYTQQADYEDSILRQETWRFLAPDGTTELELTFFTLDGTEFTEADKLTVFRGLTPTPVRELDLAKLNKG